METNILTYRTVLRITIEAATPLSVGCGKKNITTDAVIATDVNGLPYIPGTSLAGVLRHAMAEIDMEKTERLFGSQNLGSELIFSDAVLVGEDGNAIDGLCTDLESTYYQRYKNLPIRQHVRIGHNGTTSNTGKYDGEVVYKGTRFVFDIENISNEINDNDVLSLLQKMVNDTFRIGSGTRNGFGAIKIVRAKSMTFDLADRVQMLAYIKHSSSLASSFEGKDISIDKPVCKCTQYSVTLKPDDFFMFGAGHGDSDADMTSVHEDVVIWNNGKPEFCSETILIPATSLKGALAHRTAYYYNKLQGVYADNITEEEFKQHTGDNNLAVRELFGSTTNGITRGNVIFSDIIEQTDILYKVLPHVAIDRFTNAPINGALFQEKVSLAGEIEFKTVITLTKSIDTPNVVESFEHALQDLCNGLLPLGGGVNRGNGRFTGCFTKGE